MFLNIISTTRIGVKQEMYRWYVTGRVVSVWMMSAMRYVDRTNERQGGGWERRKWKERVGTGYK